MFYGAPNTYLDNQYGNNNNNNFILELTKNNCTNHYNFKYDNKFINNLVSMENI